MQALISAIISGYTISLSGTLPLGNLNMTAMYIAARQRAVSAIQFALGVAIIEVLYLRIALMAVDWILHHRVLFRVLQWSAVLMLLLLSIGSFMALNKQQQENKLVDNNMNRFALGMVMSAVNPMQFPFWAGWSVYLVSANWLHPGMVTYNVFALAAGAGTLTALFLFILAGAKLSAFMQKNKKGVQVFMGIVFLLLAAYQVYNLLLNN